MTQITYTKEELEAIAYFSNKSIAERENQEDNARLAWFKSQERAN